MEQFSIAQCTAVSYSNEDGSGTTCANCENFLSERIASSRVMVIINGHQSHVT